MNQDEIRPGDLIAFQIGEAEGFSAPNRDCWGVIKVIDLGDGAVTSFTVSVKSGLWKHRPTRWQAYRSPILVERRHAKLGNSLLKPRPLIITTLVDCCFDLIQPEKIGRELWFNAAEKEAKRQINLGQHMTLFACVDYAARSIDHEHRFEFDEERWRIEVKAFQEKIDQAHREKVERQQERLKAATIATLLQEEHFLDWVSETSTLPSDFANEVRSRSKDLLTNLNALGEKPGRKDARMVLRRYVDWLNATNIAFDDVIETSEREDLMKFIEEVCWAIRQKPLLNEVEGWRDW